MKLGLLSDIHGNYLALEAVLNSAEEKGVDVLLLAGDLIGYYFWPKEIMGLLSSWDTIAVRGNHEEMLNKAFENPLMLTEIEREYGCGLRVALNSLTAKQLDWLTSLPHPREMAIDGQKILLCHGSPWSLDDYIYPDLKTTTKDRFLEMDFDWIILGHTHYPMMVECGKTKVVNPGSVGQPRNREPGAHWATLDTKSLQFKKYIEEYDIDLVAEQTRAREPDIPYLREVLVRQ